LKQLTRSGLVQRELRRVHQADLFGAQVPVAGRGQAPGQVGHVHAIGSSLVRRPGQEAAAAGQAQRAGQCAFVRGRKARLFGGIAPGLVQSVQQGLQPWQGQCGGGLAASL
jgi:hypothetical protein